jgi:Spy/CpxP family protein refolding chaperone
MRKVIFFALALMTALFTAVLAADGPRDGQGAGPGDGPGIMGAEGVFRFVDELKLTDDQTKQLHDLRDSSKRDLFTARNEMMMTVWDIQDEMKKDSPDKTKLYSLSDKIADSEKKIARLRIDQMLRIKSILTKEQFEKLTHMIDAKKQQAKKRFLGGLFPGGNK